MKELSRRAFIPALGAVCLSATLPFQLGEEPLAPLKSIKPKRLFAGDLIAVCAPAGPLRDISHADIFKSKLEALGFRVVIGRNVKKKFGFFTATDEERAKEFMEFVSDDTVKAIVCMKGGWGCARILPLIDYTTIANHPKIIMGFSDITSLINAITLKTGLITFHGPSGNSTWNDFSLEYIRSVLVRGEHTNFENPKSLEDKTTTLVSGTAEGELFGGNLSVLCALVGTPYFPNLKNKILFLEEVDEEPFRVDRMITHLELAGIFNEISGLVIGKFRKCEAEEPLFSFTCDEIFQQHFSAAKFPVYSGAMIGHIRDKFTLPIGLSVKINADKGTIHLLEPAVI